MSDGLAALTQNLQADMLSVADSASKAETSAKDAVASQEAAYAAAQSASTSAAGVTQAAASSLTNANQAQYWAGVAQAVNAIKASFDPVSRSVLIALSNANLTARFPVGQAGILGNVGHGAGQHYFEVTFVSGSASSNCSIGVAPKKQDLNSQIGYNDNSSGSIAAFQNSGNIYSSASKLATTDSFGTAGAVVGVAVDSDKNLVWIRVNNGHWNGNPSADPVEGVVGLPIRFTGAVYPAMATDVVSTYTANFNGPFANTIPTGYNAWGADAFQYVVPLATKDTPGVASFGEGLAVDAQGNVTASVYYDLATTQGWDTMTLDLSTPQPLYHLVLNATQASLAFANLNLPAGKALRFTLYVEQGTGANTITQWDSRIQWCTGSGQAPVLAFAKGARNVFEFETIDGVSFAGYYVGQLNASGA
jgi:hypothetical protein